MLNFMFLLAHLDQSSVLTSLIEDHLTPITFVTGLVIASGLGAFHALSPGHGKMLVSSYLIGTKGTAFQAIILGLTVSLTHTIGVIILGLITLLTSQYILPETLYPILSIVSGLMVLGVGMTLLYRRLLSQKDHHHHHHHEDRNHDHSHHHHDTNMSSSLIALGVAGGLVPCPSALVLLLSSVTLHKIPYGLLLTGSFSLGLALVLVILGLLTVYAHQWFEGVSFPTSWLKNLSVFSAVFVVLIGLGLTTFSILEVI